MGEPVEVAHIYPWSLGQRDKSVNQVEFWKNLELFWSAAKVAEWTAALLGPFGTETCQNLLCLSDSVHTLWAKTRFALQPLEITDDGKTLRTRFWWFPVTSPSQVPITQPPNVPSDLDSGHRTTILINSLTREIIKSGDIIEIHTEDTARYPLPSMALLEMQWVLNRLVAISGAAEAVDEDESSDSELDEPSTVDVEDLEEEAELVDFN